MAKEKIRVMFYLSKELAEKLKEIKEEYGYNQSGFVEVAIKEYIENHIK